ISTFLLVGAAERIDRNRRYCHRVLSRRDSNGIPRARRHRAKTNEYRHEGRGSRAHRLRRNDAWNAHRSSWVGEPCLRVGCAASAVEACFPPRAVYQSSTRTEQIATKGTK